MAVNFSRKDESAYQVLSKSFNSNPSFSVAAGTVTVPANCYVSIATLEVAEVEGVWNDTSASAMMVHKEGNTIVVDYASGPVGIYTVDGRKTATLRNGGRVEACSGVYVVTDGKDTVKIVI